MAKKKVHKKRQKKVRGGGDAITAHPVPAAALRGQETAALRAARAQAAGAISFRVGDTTVSFSAE